LLKCRQRKEKRKRMNKIKKSIFYGFCSFLVISSLVNCGQNSAENKMYGTWEMFAFISSEDFRKFSEEPFPDGMEMEMTMKGMQSYHKDGKYSGEGEITLRIITPKGEIPLRVSVQDAGEWSLDAKGVELVETTTDGTFTPLDDLTGEFLKKSPEVAALFKPVKGETIISRVLSISESTMEIELDEPKLKLILKKSTKAKGAR